MASYKHKEFVKFCLTGKKQKNGNLVMSGNEVYSYALKIAEVNRDTMTITYIKNPRRSLTTSMHVGSCSGGAMFIVNENPFWSVKEIDSF